MVRSLLTAAPTRPGGTHDLASAQREEINCNGHCDCRSTSDARNQHHRARARRQHRRLRWLDDHQPGKEHRGRCRQPRRRGQRPDDRACRHGDGDRARLGDEGGRRGPRGRERRSELDVSRVHARRGPDHRQRWPGRRKPGHRHRHVEPRSERRHVRRLRRRDRHFALLERHQQRVRRRPRDERRGQSRQHHRGAPGLLRRPGHRQLGRAARGRGLAGADGQHPLRPLSTLRPPLLHRRPSRRRRPGRVHHGDRRVPHRVGDQELRLRHHADLPRPGGRRHRAGREPRAGRDGDRPTPGSAERGVGRVRQQPPRDGVLLGVHGRRGG